MYCVFLVGMVKAPTSEPSEFTMSSKDFPALPGTQPLSVTTTSSTTTDPNQQSSTTSGSTTISLEQNGMQSSTDHLSDQRLNNQTDSSSLENGESGTKKGVQTSPDGLYSKLPY